MKCTKHSTKCILHAKSSLWVSHHNFFSQSVIKCEDLIDPMIIWHEILNITKYFHSSCALFTNWIFQISKLKIKYSKIKRPKKYVKSLENRPSLLVAYLSSVRFFSQCRLSDIYRWIILLFVRQKHKVEHTQYMRK